MRVVGGTNNPLRTIVVRGINSCDTDRRDLCFCVCAVVVVVYDACGGGNQRYGVGGGCMKKWLS